MLSLPAAPTLQIACHGARNADGDGEQEVDAVSGQEGVQVDFVCSTRLPQAATASPGRGRLPGVQWRTSSVGPACFLGSACTVLDPATSQVAVAGKELS